MKHVSVIAFGSLFFSTVASATVTTFTSSADFLAANPNTAVIEDFEDSNPDDWQRHLSSYTGPQGQITFTPISGYPYEPNLALEPAGFTEFGLGVSPISSVALTTNGNEDFVGTLLNPAFALGFDLFLNDSPGTVTFFNGDRLLATLTFDSPVVVGSNQAFAGIYSSEGITSFHWQASNGERVDTGIDNIVAAPMGAVPELGTWAMMIFGFGCIGLALRRREQRQLARCRHYPRQDLRPRIHRH